MHLKHSYIERTYLLSRWAHYKNTHTLKRTHTHIIRRTSGTSSYAEMDTTVRSVSFRRLHVQRVTPYPDLFKCVAKKVHHNCILHAFVFASRMCLHVCLCVNSCVAWQYKSMRVRPFTAKTNNQYKCTLSSFYPHSLLHRSESLCHPPLPGDLIQPLCQLALVPQH
jgi:hypothetical protein